MVQHMAMSQVRAGIRERGTTAAHLSRQCGFTDRHPRWLMAGELWARLTDLRALADSLEMDLLLLAGPAGEDGRHRVLRLLEMDTSVNPLLGATR